METPRPATIEQTLAPESGAVATLDGIAAPEALEAAWLRVRGKRAAPGLDAVSVDDFDAHASRDLAMLAEELRAETYLPAPLRRVSIPKPSHPGEQRALGLPSVRDKIVQESVRAALEPLAERRFFDTSYGYRPGRGPARAIARICHHVRSLKHTWVLRADIDDCFNSLPRGGVLDAVTTLGADTGVRRLVDLWLQMGALDWRGRWHDTVDGIPQGSVVSPLLANLYLHRLDEAMRGRADGYVRYADDLVVTARTEEDCRRASDAIVASVSSLGLRLNTPLAPPTPVARGFEFLGIAFGPDGLTLGADRLARAHAAAARHAARAHEDPADAARRLDETITGWRRYYGTVLPGAALTGLDAEASVAWVALLRDARHVPAALTKSAATDLVAGATGVVTRDEAALKAWRRALVEKAWNAAPAHSPVDAQAAPAAPARRPAARSRRAGRDSSRPPVPVPTVVRRCKRETLRRNGVLSELVVATPGAFVAKQGERLVVRLKRSVLAEAPIARIHAVTLASEGLGISADALTLCTAHDVPVLFTGWRDEVHAMVVKPDGAPARVAMLQAEALADPRRTVDLARRFVDGKLRNQRNLLKYLGKYRRQDPVRHARLEAATAVLDRTRGDARAVDPSHPDATGQLFSAEGRGAQAYWEAIGALLPAAVAFPGRQHQGARDLANSLLNYGYAVLKSRVYLALLKAGLNPGISFLHSTHRHDPTLVYDLVEEFRAPVVDRTVMALLDRREVTTLGADGRLAQDARKRLLAHLHARLATLVRFRSREMALGDIIDLQARAIVQHLEGAARYRAYAAPW